MISLNHLWLFWKWDPGILWRIAGIRGHVWLAVAPKVLYRCQAAAWMSRPADTSLLVTLNTDVDMSDNSRKNFEVAESNSVRPGSGLKPWIGSSSSVNACRWLVQWLTSPDIYIIWVVHTAWRCQRFKNWLDAPLGFTIRSQLRWSGGQIQGLSSRKQSQCQFATRKIELCLSLN